MRIANRAGRLVLLTRSGLVDVHTASDGLFDPDPAAAYGRWDELCAWADARGDARGVGTGLADDELAGLGAPAPDPRQVLCIGLNYEDHIVESGAQRPEALTVFTKFPTSLTGPAGEVALPTGSVDWEVELVLVVGRGGRDIPRDEAWGRLAGVTGGQDLSARDVQLRPPAPQFSLGKSFRGFAPTGPFVVTPDELADRDDVSLACSVNGTEVQGASTSLLVFDVPEIVSALSRVVELLPGDLVFTGTPAGVGLGRDPQTYLAPGDVLETTVEGVGRMRHTFVGDAS